MFYCSLAGPALHGSFKPRMDTQRDMPANCPGDSDTRPGVALGEIKQELMADESQDSPESARMRANKKMRSEDSYNASMPSASHSSSTLLYEAHEGTGTSSVRNTDAMDNQLALFLGLRGIDQDQVRRAGMEERANILPQLEAELRQCSMLKLVQFFRQFLERDDFDSFAKQLYTWIQDAPAARREEVSNQTCEQHLHEDSMSYLDEDKLRLLHIFRSLLETEANTSCTQFERGFELTSWSRLSCQRRQNKWPVVSMTPCCLVRSKYGINGCMRKALKPTGCRCRSMILYASFGETTGLNTSELLEVPYQSSRQSCSTHFSRSYRHLYCTVQQQSPVANSEGDSWNI